MQNKNKALVTLCPVPFVNSQKEFFYYDGENTVAELLSKARVPASCVLQVYLNGHLVKEGYYEEAVVKPGNVLLVRIFPQGSKEDRKNIFRVAAFVYLGIAAQQWGESVGLALGASAKTAYAIGSAVITFGGTLLINALIPPPVKAVQARVQDTRDEVYNITGIQNKADPYAPVPIIYGKTKRFPQYAARPFTTVEGNDQILHCLFCIGHAETPADLILSDLKIGETSIEDYEGVSWEYWDGRPTYREVDTVEGPRTSFSIPIFPNRVSEAVGVKVERGDGTGWVERTTATDTNSIIVDIEFPQLVGYNTESGARFSRTVEFEIQYKKTTDTTYDAFDPIQNETILVDDAYVQNLNTPRRNYGVATFGETILVFGGTSIATGAKLDTIERFDGDSWTVLGHTLPVPAARIGAVKTSYAYYYIFGPDFGANIYVLFDSGVVNLSLTIGVPITTSRGFMASGEHPAGPFSTYYRSVLFLENQTVGAQTGLYSVEIVHRGDSSSPADGFVAGPNGSLITTVRGMCPLYSGAPSLLIQGTGLSERTVWYKVKFYGLWNGRRQASLTVASYNMRRSVSGQTYVPVDMTAMDNANIHKAFVLYHRYSGSTLVGYAVGRMDAFGNGEVTDIVAFGTPEPSAALQVVPYYVRLSGDRISHRWMVCGDTMRGTSGDGVKTVTGASNATVRASFAMDGLETGQYNVRIRRVTADNTATNIADEMYWAQLVSQREGTPVLKYDAAYLYLKVRASNQLSGMLSNFNCMVEARHWVPDLSGSEITYNKEFTQNPAWAYLMLLTSTACKTPLPYTKVDIEGLQEFADFCDTNGFTFNYVFDKAETSVYEYSRIALSAGRATPAFRDDGKYSLVVDDVRENYVHIFTPRNSWGFSGTKSFSKIPHALRCNFINEDEDYQQDERIVYSGSYTAETATEFETMNLEGITDAEHVFKIGKYFLNAAALRPEVFELKSDPESFPCTRGDRVEVVSDVALIGMGCGRISGYDTNIGGQITAIYTDNKIATEAATDYVMRIRLPEVPGEYAEHVVRVAATAENDTFIPQAPLPLASVEIMNGLFILGLEDYTTFPCVVKSIEYSTMLEATLTLVPYDPNIFSLGTIPAFDSRITSTIEIEKGFPEKPVLHEVGGKPAIASDSSSLALMSNGTLQTGVVFTLYPINSNRVRPDYVRVALRRTGDTDAPWTQEAPQSVESGVAFAYAVEDGVSYDFKIRYETAAGLASEWTLVENYTVVGAPTPPSDFVFTAHTFTRLLTVSWEGDSSRKFSYTEIRTNTNWGESAGLLYRGRRTTLNISGDVLLSILDNRTVTVYGSHFTSAGLPSETTDSKNLTKTAPTPPVFTITAEANQILLSITVQSNIEGHRIYMAETIGGTYNKIGELAGESDTFVYSIPYEDWPAETEEISRFFKVAAIDYLTDIVADEAASTSAAQEGILKFRSDVGVSISTFSGTETIQNFLLDEWGYDLIDQFAKIDFTGTASHTNKVALKANTNYSIGWRVTAGTPTLDFTVNGTVYQLTSTVTALRFETGAEEEVEFTINGVNGNSVERMMLNEGKFLYLYRLHKDDEPLPEKAREQLNIITQQLGETLEELGALRKQVDLDGSAIYQSDYAITLKVGKDGVVSALNLTPQGAVISGRHIVLDGLTRFINSSTIVYGTVTEVDGATIRFTASSKNPPATSFTGYQDSGNFTVTVTSRDAEGIYTGTVTAGSAVTGFFADSNVPSTTIDGDLITTGTIDADKIIAGSISTEQLKAKEIFTERLQVQGTTNIVIDGETGILLFDAEAVNTFTSTASSATSLTKAGTSLAVDDFVKILDGNNEGIVKKVTGVVGDVISFSAMEVGFDSATVQFQAYTKNSHAYVHLTEAGIYLMPAGGGAGSLAISPDGIVWGQVTGANKPADNATVGADWTTNLINKPSELHQIFYSESTPTGAATGDLWIVISTQKLYRYNGTTWNLVQDEDIAQAIADAGTAQATADGKIKTFSQAAEPTGEVSDEGDIWIKTDANNKMYRYSGSAWVALPYDVAEWSKVTGAGKPADNATKNVISAGTTAHADPIEGDLWYDTNASVVALKRFDGTNWGIVGKNPGYIEATKITSTTIESPTISANDGKFTGIVQVGSSGDRIIIDGTAGNENIRSANYKAGVSGWIIKQDGAQFNDITMLRKQYTTEFVGFGNELPSSAARNPTSYGALNITPVNPYLLFVLSNLASADDILSFTLHYSVRARTHDITYPDWSYQLVWVVGGYTVTTGWIALELTESYQTFTGTVEPSMATAFYEMLAAGGPIFISQVIVYLRNDNAETATYTFDSSRTALKIVYKADMGTI